MPKTRFSDVWPRRRLSKFIQNFQAILESGHGRVEGVEIDLRHADLSIDDWYSPEISHWGIPGHPWYDSAPLVFPWHWREAVSNETTVVEPGDKISIARIETVQIGDQLEHEADREVRQIYLEIARSHGTPPAVLDDFPIRFYRYGSFLPRGSWGGLSFKNIARRISEANKVRRIFDLCVWSGPVDDNEPDGREPEWAEQLLIRAQTLAIEREAIMATIDRRPLKFSKSTQSTPVSWPTYRERHAPDGFDVKRAIDHAMALGFLWAKFEDGKVRGLADKAMRSWQGLTYLGPFAARRKRRKGKKLVNSFCRWPANFGINIPRFRNRHWQARSSISSTT